MLVCYKEMFVLEKHARKADFKTISFNVKICFWCELVLKLSITKLFYLIYLTTLAYGYIR